MSKSHLRTRVRESFASLPLIATLALLFAPIQHLFAQTVLPSGFAERQYAAGLSNPTAMAFAPDPCPASGTPVRRLFVCEQGGRVRVFRNGVLQSQPFVTVVADTRGERGLDGICFDPNFANNHYVYIYYTIRQADTSAPTHNRLIRVTADPANPDVALAGSGTPIMEMDDLSPTAFAHNGGGLHFGPDDKLYISVGENTYGPNAQSLSTVLGKILRINPVPENPDGTNPESTFPTDNPFYNSTTGKNRAIYALGVRNPFTFAFQRGTGRMFIDDVGASTWEEINLGSAGANYGWPTIEGPAQPPVAGFRNPIYAYQHFSGTPRGCAITGGDFYNPPPLCSGDPPYGFPSSYVGQYFFLDLCGGWIYTMNPNQIDPASPYGFHRITPFASGIHGSPTYLIVGPDSNLYYISRDDGAVYQIRYPVSLSPTIGTQPADVLVGQGWPATFSVEASGAPTLHYRWQQNDTDISGAADAPSYTVPNPQVATDNGARYRCLVSNSFGNTATREAILSVITQQPPIPTISSPRPNTYYDAGDTITFAGSAVDGHDIVTGDPQDGVLAPSAFTWVALFEHHSLSNPNHHTHPFFPPTSGIAGGTFTISTSGETDPDVWYRIFLSARDSYGLSTTIFRDIFPRHVQLRVTTNPALFSVKVDGSPKAAPYPFWSVVHLIRSIGVDTPQVVNGLTYDFVSWSDHGARFHNISAPATATGYVANFWKRPGYGSITANPNPMQVSDGSGAGATTIFWSSGQTNEVEVHLGAPRGDLVARSGPGSFSQLTNKSIHEGTKFYLQDVSNHQPLTSTFTLDAVTLHVTTAPTASITADPNPFVADSEGVGQTTLAWTSYGTTAVEIHVNTPNGNRFAGSGPGTFSALTGHWVRDGMTFYLQNTSNGLPLTAANTLARVTMAALSPSPPTGSISARPNPFIPDSQGRGQTTLTWTSAGITRVEVHASAPNGNRVVESGPGTFSATTGQWVRDGMTFYLQNVSNDLPLTSANTLAQVTMAAQ
jgi:glucose/arabinose dehydrogenase